jgi:beta-glucosidase
MYPQGLRKLLLYVKEKYGNPPIYITEKGNFCLPHFASSPCYHYIGLFLRSSRRNDRQRRMLKIIYSMCLGVAEVNNQSLPLQEALKDDTRIEYHHKHLLALQSAIRSELQ